jgi:hypothetical protein
VPILGGLRSSAIDDFVARDSQFGVTAPPFNRLFGAAGLRCVALAPKE